MVRGQQYETLSDKPENVRARLRRKDRKIKRTEGDMLADVEMLPRYKNVAEWDFEELARGKPRCSDGTFKGPSPSWITPLIRKEAERRLVDLARQELAAHVADAIEVMVNLMHDDSVDEETGKPYVSASVKLDASKFIIEQIMGKARQRVDVGADTSVSEFLAQFSGGLVTRQGQAYRPVRGARVITEEGEDVDDA
jgi:hypothetical protein